MSSRDKIINNIKAANLVDTGLPVYDFTKGESQDWLTLFRDSAQKAASKFFYKKEIKAPTSGKLINLSKHIPLQSADIHAITSPYELTDIGLLVIDGAFGVAENGAIWVTSKEWPFRVLPFIAEHLVICIPKENIVGNMHDAYARIESEEYDFGVFIAGPSKTADIEQSLVIGAQGARSLSIVLV